MNCIVCRDRNWESERAEKLLVSIPEDMKFFRKMTTGKTVICGRKDTGIFPGKALPNRRNIILTHQKDFAVLGALVVHTPEEAMKAAADEKPEDVFVIGGASVYKQLLPYCDTAYVTKIDYAYMKQTRISRISTCAGMENVRPGRRTDLLRSHL